MHGSREAQLGRKEVFEPTATLLFSFLSASRLFPYPASSLSLMAPSHATTSHNRNVTKKKKGKRNVLPLFRSANRSLSFHLSPWFSPIPFSAPRDLLCEHLAFFSPSSIEGFRLPDSLAFISPILLIALLSPSSKQASKQAHFGKDKRTYQQWLRD